MKNQCGSLPHFTLVLVGPSTTKTLLKRVLVWGLLLVTPSLWAATDTWTQLVSGNASGSWNTAANPPWSTGALPTATATADFSQQTLTADSTVTLDASQSINALIFGNTAGSPANNWILSPGTPSSSILTLGGTTPTITVNALGTGKSATISSILAGTTAWTKAGAGTLILSGANSFSGTPTTLSAGTLQIGNGGTTGSLGTSGNVTVTGASTTLAFNRLDPISSPYTVNTITGNGTDTPNIVVNSGAVQLGGSSDNSYANAVVNGGTLILAKASTSSIHALGATSTVNSGGTLQLAGTGSSQIFSGASLTVNSGGVFDLNGMSLNLGGLTLGGALINSAASTTSYFTNTTLSPTGTIGGAGNITYVGKINSGPLVKVGAGTLTLEYGNAANNWGTATIVNGGTLALNTSLGAVTFGSASGTTTMGGGTLDLGATSQTVAGVNITNAPSSGNTIQNGTLASSGSFNTAGLPATANANITAILAGTGSLTASGAGELTLSALNTYTGSTYVKNGTLNLNYTAGNNIVNTASILNLGSGAANTAASYTFTLSGASGAANTQAFAGGANGISYGLGHINLVPGASGGTIVLQSGFTARAGSGCNLEFNVPSGGTVNFAGANSAGSILGLNAGSTCTFSTSGVGQANTWAVSGSPAAQTAVTTSSTGNLLTTTGTAPTVGQQVVFTTIPASSGLTANQIYYVLTRPSGTTFTIGASPSGTTTTLVNSTGSGTMYVEGPVSGLPTASYVTVGNPSGTQNFDAGTGATLTSSPNTIRFNYNGPSTVTLNSGLLTALTSGGILVTPAVAGNLTKITGGLALTGLNRRELAVFQNNPSANLQIDTSIGDVGGGGSTSFVKNGSGTVVLTSGGTYNNYTLVNEGTLITSGDYVASVTKTGNNTSGTKTVTMSDTTGIFVGEEVTSTALTTANTTWYVTAINPGVSVTLNLNGNGGTSASFVFTGSGGLGVGVAAGGISVAPGATLQIGNAGANGSLFPGQTMANNGAVTFNRTDTGLTFANVISGSGGVTNAGTGTVTFNATETYTGPTTISAGTLALGASGALSASSSVNIAAGATFDVSGLGASATYTLGGSASLTASGTASAATINGGSSGTVSLGSRPIILNYDGSDTPLTVSQGTLSLSGNTFTVLSSSPLGQGVYTLVSTPNTISGSVNATPSYGSGSGVASSLTGIVSISGNNVILTVSPAITATQSANGAINPSGTTSVAYNGSQTYTITPTGGYSVATLTVDGSSVTPATSYTFNSVTANHTITATFALNTYTVTFNPQGGSVSPTTATVTYASTYGTLPTPTQTGYTFNGWFTAASGGSPVTSASTVTITAAQTLYAQWTPNTYTVTFNPEGGSVSPTTTTVTYASTYGTLPTPTQTGYTFNGWFTAASGGSLVTSATTVAITAAQTLYAQWTPNTYTVTFNPEGGSVSPSTATVTYASTYGTLPTPTQTGYTFNGWFTAASGGVLVTSATTVIITAAQTLYAQWTPNTYTVTFNPEGGSVSPTTATVTYASTYGTLPTPAYTGYAFNGWFTASSGAPK